MDQPDLSYWSNLSCSKYINIYIYFGDITCGPTVDFHVGKKNWAKK